MTQLTGEITYNCIKRTGKCSEEHGVLLREHAMDIYANGEFYASVICTEDRLEELVIGRFVCDGMMQSMDEIKSLTISDDCSVADVELVESGSDAVLVQEYRVNYPDEWIFAMADKMVAGMELHEKTWSAHSCFLYKEGELLFSCEDISRHNAVDKVIGYAVKNRIDLSVCALYSSGRVPLDMMDKIVVVGIPILVSKGMPTMQAVELAKEAKVTLICGARKDQMRIYTDYRL